MGTCPMFGDVDKLVGIVLANINVWRRHILKVKASVTPHGSNVCELEYVIIVEESNSIG
jgi:hypothetical protein